MNVSALVSRWKYVALLGGGSAMFLWQLSHPFIRFESSGANAVLAFVLGLVLPWLTAVALFRLEGRWSRVMGFAALIPLLLHTAVFLLGSAMSAFSFENGRDLSFQLFTEIPWRGSRVRLYRANAGATTDFGVVIRQERNLLPGVLLVRVLDSFYHCYSLDAASTDGGVMISDGRAACTAFQRQRHEYRLTPFLYF